MFWAQHAEDRILRQSILTGLLILNAFSAAKAEDNALGKYACVITHLAGSDGKRTGSFQPDEEKFIVDLHYADHPSDQCKEHDGSEVDWFICRAHYEVRIGERLRLRGDFPWSFIGAPSIDDDEFTLSVDRQSFVEFETVHNFGGNYVAEGKCSKF
jgi:hypothetical protein